jgi:hypothetical protein
VGKALGSFWLGQLRGRAGAGENSVALQVACATRLCPDVLKGYDGVVCRHRVAVKHGCISSAETLRGSGRLSGDW